MPNRLARETSPYLLQHAENPVEWYPWGPEALDRARAENLPILLSIGYSACHWCHVMERESFEDPDVAEVMNRSFVNVKVDREERPDVDQVYMKAVQAMTGHGGWPLTVFLTPEGKPFYGGTYFPPVPRQGMPSFRQVLDAAAEAFLHRREDVERGAGEIAAALAAAHAGSSGADADGVVGVALMDDAMRALARQYDPAHGGFGRAPKFPQPATLEVLLRQHARTGDPQPLQMALTTLRRMAGGGIRDHLAGGFHRYSVDARWLVPHFEKMLYDNALLAQAYLDAYRLTGFEDLITVTLETLDYLLEDLRSPEGGFYAARDADSEGEEGKFYVWSVDEVVSVLGPGDASLFCRVYDVTAPGNFEGANILWLPHGIGDVARSLGEDENRIRNRLAGARSALIEARASRVPPFRDEKVLVSWNGLAVRALAEAGGVLGRPDYVEAAETCAGFLLSALRPQGALLHTWKDGEAKVPAFLEDFAALGNALLSLHEVTLEHRWLADAHGCATEILARFWDGDAGLLHDTAHDADPLFLRPRDPMDTATPSGNSLAAELLARLGHLIGDDGFASVARRLVAREREAMERYPTAFGRLLSVADRLAADPVEVVIVGEPGDPATRALVQAALRPFHRNRTVSGTAPGAPAHDLPLLEGRTAVDGRATAYVCHGYACQAPVTDAEVLAGQVREAAGRS